MFGKHWSLAGGLVSLWCNAFWPGLFAPNVITLDLSALVRSSPKYIGDREIPQRMFIIIKRPLSTRFRLLNIFSPKGILNPLSWLRLTGLYVIEALFHMLPPNDHWPADLLYRGREWHGVAAWLRKPCTQTGAQGATADRPVGHWTRLQDSPTVASTVTRTRILL